MKAALPENTVEVPASGYWPFGLHIEPTPKGLLLRPARKPRAGWAKAFRACVSDADSELAELRNAANEFDGKDWQW